MRRQRETLLNVVEEGIKGDVRSALENKRWRAAVILTLSGIDTMAYLGLPPDAPPDAEVHRRDFIN
jgi:hypothetical protein